MSIELKQAAQQALDALVKSKNALEVLWVSHHANRTDYAIEDIDSAIEALLTAIQQAEAQQPATGDPVGQVSDLFPSVRNKLHAKGFGSDAPLYTHPAPGVPDEVMRDADRYRWLCEKLGQTQLPTLIERITAGYVADYKPSIDEAIDAAMLAASPAQKGQP